MNNKTLLFALLGLPMLLRAVKSDPMDADWVMVYSAQVRVIQDPSKDVLSIPIEKPTSCEPLKNLTTLETATEFPEHLPHYRHCAFCDGENGFGGIQENRTMGMHFKTHCSACLPLRRTFHY